jgi:type IV secretion system protein VirB9
MFYHSKHIFIFAALFALPGCVTHHGKPPPTISLNEPVLQRPTSEPPAPPELAVASATEIIEIPKPLPLPGQLVPVEPDKATVDGDPRSRVTRANQDALVTPSRDGYLNAIQVWPYAEGALYQLYTSPGRVTAIVLQAGETLTAVSAGDTARWIVGDTSSGSGNDRRVQILVKPTRSDLKTNMVITTDRRTYLLDLNATANTWMASVSWEYPRDRLTAIKNAADNADAAAPIAGGLTLEQLHFRYAITGDNPPWRPLRAFDDGEHVYIQFPSGIAQGEWPPLFVVGPDGDAQLVNYRVRAPYYVIDRLFGAAELRLSGNKAQVVRIARTDGVRSAAR